MPDRKIRELRLCGGSSTELQKTIITGIITKNVRLDVLFENDDTWFDIEIQTGSDVDLPLRGRYYSSAMDIDQIKQGAKYGQLKHSYVIFICTFDYYKLKQAVYFFQNYDCKNHLPYGDKSFKIIVNTTVPKENTPPELIPFFDYVNRMEVPTDDAFIQALHNQVEKYNATDWRRKLMTLEEKMNDLFAEGEAKKNLENAKKMKDEGLSTDLISRITDLSKEEIEKL